MTRKVVVLSTELPPGPGGIGAHAHNLARAGHRAGWDVTVVAPQDYVDDDARQAFNRSIAHRIVTVDRSGAPVRRAWRRLMVSRRVLREVDPDVVLATGERSVWVAALLLGRRRPWLAQGHGAEYGTSSRWRRWATRAALARSSGVVCNSEYTRTAMLAMGVAPPSSVVIHPGADHERLGPDAEAGATFRHDHGLGAEPVILTVGNVSERKGQDLVVEALADPRLGRVHYVMVGLPNRGASIVTRAETLGVADRVHVLGPLSSEDLLGAYNACDVFAMTSRHDSAGDFEGYGIAVIEAALCEKPAVVTGGSGLEEAVVHDVTGLVVASGDVGAIASALDELLHDPHRRVQMGVAGAARARQENDWDRIAVRIAKRFDVAVAAETPDSGTSLLVVSDTPYHRADGELVGWGPTIRELDHLRDRFERIVHVAPLYPGPAPRSSRGASRDGVEVRLVQPAGGRSLTSKLGVLARWPAWHRAIRASLSDVDPDVLHIRCPSNIALLALISTRFARRRPPTWVKFAGNWRPTGKEPWSYALQRRWLRRGSTDAVVTVNGPWADEPGHVVSLHNPTLDGDDLRVGQRVARRKELRPIFRLAYVGRLDEAKGAMRAVEVLVRLVERELPVALDVVGDGPLRSEMQSLAEVRGLTDRVAFHGWMTRSELEVIYGRAHFLILPTDSEGFPKVLAEAMAFGAVPLAGAVSSIPRTLAEIGTGVALQSADLAGFADVIEAYVAGPERWERERDRGLLGAKRFSYEDYLRDVDALLRDRLGVGSAERTP